MDNQTTDNLTEGTDNSRLQALLSSLPDTMCVISSAGTVIECHGNDHRGVFDPSAMKEGVHVTDAFHPEIARHIMESVESALRLTQTYISEVEIPANNIKNFFELRSRKYGPGEALLIIRDITTQKEFEATLTHLFEEVSRSKMQWETTFNSVSEFIIIADSLYRVIRCNKSFGEFIGREPSELAGENLNDLLQISPSDRDKNLAMLSEGKPVTSAWVDSRGRWLYMTQKPLFDPQFAKNNLVITVSDITDILTVQQELLRQDKELKERVEELERFYNMVIGREIKMRELKKRNLLLEREIENLKTPSLDT